MVLHPISPPNNFLCSSCSCMLSMTGGAVNEIHIYTAANQFEKSITIMDAVWEMFGLCPSSGPLKMDNLKVARENGFPLVMCSKCAEAVSILYKDFLNLLQLSPAAGGGYLNTLLLHFESWATTTTGKQVMRPGFVHEEEISGGHEINNQETFIQYEQEQSDVLQYHQQAPIPEEGIDILGTGSSNLLAVAVSYPEPQDSDYDPFFESSSHSSSQEMEEPHTPPRRKVKKRKLAKPPKPVPVTPSAETAPSNVIQKKYRKAPRKSEYSVSGQISATGGPNRYFFRCSLCSKSFLLNWELHIHNLSVHEGKEPDTCPRCDWEYYPQVFKPTTHICVEEKQRELSETFHTYLCTICGVDFRGDKILKYHKDNVHVLESVKFECTICSKNLIRRASLLAHYSQHYSSIGMNNAEQGIFCMYCSTEFLQSDELERHIASEHSEDNPEVCTECGKRFRERDRKMAHMRNVHGIRKKISNDRSTACGVCGKNFLTPKGIRKHIEFKHGSEDAKKYQCNICAKRFWTRGKLRSHMAIHTYGTNANTNIPKELAQYNLKYVCKFCPISFDYKAHADLHNRNFHAKEISFDCTVCSITLPTRLELLLHNRKHMSSEEKKMKGWNKEGVEGEYDCDICGKAYKTLKHLFTHHTYVHVENEEMNCELCQKKLRRRNLNFHYKCFHPEKYAEICGIPEDELRNQQDSINLDSLECDVCNNGKKFPTKYRLMEHKMIHEGAHLRVTCPKCGEKLRSRAKLKEHNRVHHAEPNVIPRLGKKARPSAAETKDEILRCDICNNGRIYSSRKTLKEHKQMHKDTALKRACPECGKLFRTLTKVKDHLKAMHPPKVRAESLIDSKKKRKKLLVVVKEEPKHSVDTADEIGELNEEVPLSQYIFMRTRKWKQKAQELERHKRAVVQLTPIAIEDTAY